MRVPTLRDEAQDDVRECAMREQSRRRRRVLREAANGPTDPMQLTVDGREEPAREAVRDVQTPNPAPEPLFVFPRSIPGQLAADLDA